MFFVQSAAFRMGVGSLPEAMRLAGDAVAEGAEGVAVWEQFSDRSIRIVTVTVAAERNPLRKNRRHGAWR